MASASEATINRAIRRCASEAEAPMMADGVERCHHRRRLTIGAAAHRFQALACVTRSSTEVRVARRAIGAGIK